MPHKKKLVGKSTSFGFNILVSDLDELRTIAHRRSVEAGGEVCIGDLVREALAVCYGPVQGNNSMEKR